MPKLKKYIDGNIPPLAQLELRNALGWSQYTWTWRLKNPTRWTITEVVILSKALEMTWQDCVKEFDVGKEALSPLLTG